MAGALFHTSRCCSSPPVGDSKSSLRGSKRYNNNNNNSKRTRDTNPERQLFKKVALKPAVFAVTSMFFCQLRNTKIPRSIWSESFIHLCWLESHVPILEGQFVKYLFVTRNATPKVLELPICPFIISQRLTVSAWCRQRNGSRDDFFLGLHEQR